jgi:hypothetical protein
MAKPKVVVTLDASVGINPLPVDTKGIVRGPTVVVKGTAQCTKDTSDGNPENDVTENVPQAINEVAVRFGSGGTFVKANPTGPVNKITNQKMWTTWATDPLTILGNTVGDTLEITANVSAATDTAHPVGDERSMIIKVDGTPPDLTLTTPLELTKTVQNNEATFTIAGTAQDENSPVVAVEWVVDQDQGSKFTLATPQAPGDWSTWTASVKVSPAGDHVVLVQARDGEGNTTPLSKTKATLHAVETFQPKDPNDVFQPAAYLDDQLKFAGRRIVDVKNVPLTPAMLTAAYHQRFADLTDPNNREAATAPVLQVRVCVEVLRSFIKAAKKTVLATEEAKYRQRAYTSLLRNLGTSFDEIRRTRGDEVARARLAARLGVDRTERLDSLMLLPAQVNESKLEELFGLQRTTRSPLDRASQPQLLIWQLTRLVTQWQEQDNAARVYGDIPAPVIDPDQLVETDFLTRNDSAFKLWRDRTAEMTDLITQIDKLRKSKTTPLAQFDTVVNKFVTKVENLVTLFADYQAGKDIDTRLIENRLDMSAFLRLIRSRDLAIAGTVLDADWADVYAIAAQVTKLGRYPVWRAQEQAKGLTLSPDFFVLTEPTAVVDLPEWRATLLARRSWQMILQTRINQRQDLIRTLNAAVEAAEMEVLSGLRDLLVTTAGDGAQGLLIDLVAATAQRTTRVDQAIQTLGGALFAARAGTFTTGHPAAGWKLAPTYTEADFDEDWVFWGAYDAWRGAMRVFIYPESHLLPTLRPVTDQPTNAYKDLIEKVRGFARVTPALIDQVAKEYLDQVRKEIPNIGVPPDMKITERMTDKELADRQLVSVNLLKSFADMDQVPSHLQEIFYFVPLLCALQLQRAGEYLAALDWFQTVYAYHLPPGRLTLDNLPAGTKQPPDRRQIYYGLTLNEQTPTLFRRPVNWPREGLNPHDVVQDRANSLTRFVVISLVRCFEQFADVEFTRDTDESVARALYQTALDLLGLTYPDTSSTAPPSKPDPSHEFGLDPVVQALRLHAQLNLRKLHLGLNIAGLERQLSPELTAETAVAPQQPTPYRYAALILRAKELTQTSAQMEGALLTALEKFEAESYNLLKATQDVELAGETVRLHDLQKKEAIAGIPLAAQEKQRAQLQFGHFEDLINKGTSALEIASAVLGGLGSTVSGAAQTGAFSVAGLGGALTGVGSVFGAFASRKRQEDDWILQRNLADQDITIARQKVTIAKDHFEVVKQEQQIAQMQKDHAAATVQFLAGKFTSAELYEFMSEVLDTVYRFFLQQATALAKLAENQLSFERQEPLQGVIQGDYYAVPDGAAVDRRGITGSARLLADIVQLDQHAFLTDQRRQQLKKDLSLARFAPVEFEQFRKTGVLIVGTPQSLFDRDFPGHYLRLVKRVRTSVIALIPPTDGIHATLSTSGTSRVVIAGDTFRNVVVRRDAETVGLSSPRDATGLFELVPDSQPDLLLPFEGTGVDTVWRFELPKAANPFDYSTIADIVLTIEYTALNSFDYRQQVIQTLDPVLSLDRPFSFQQQFPDQWYDLNNPEQAATPMTVRFKTALGDFLPNLDDLRTQNLVLYLSPGNGKPVEMQDVRLQFKKQSDDAPVGGSADSIDGVISTRRANGSNWLPITGDQPPIGEWELALPTDETIKKLFRNEEIEDILFVITYSGRTPAWPN